jgi:hypothetical protein
MPAIQALGKREPGLELNALLSTREMHTAPTSSRIDHRVMRDFPLDSARARLTQVSARKPPGARKTWASEI